MTTTPTQPQSEPARAKSVQPPPMQRVEPEMRRPSAVGRFFTRMLLLLIAIGVSFGGGYYVMDQEARLHRETFLQDQAAAQDRIAALEEQIREIQLNRLQENSVEIDLTDVFAPIRAAVSRLAEAQMSVVAQQISAEVARLVESDVQNMNASTPLASIAEAAAAALEPAIATMPPSGTTEAPPPPEPLAELTPGNPAAEPAPVEPGGGPAPDSEQIAPGDEAPQAPAAGVQRPAAELSDQALGRESSTLGAGGAGSPGRLPQWLLRLGDTLDSARSQLDTATSAPAPIAVQPAMPSPPRGGSTAGFGG